MSVREVLEHLSPDRIGHGVRAIEDEMTMELLQSSGVTLEVCPTSNLNTRVVRDVEGLRRVFRSLKSHRVSFTINTDGPEMLKTNLRGEIDFLLKERILGVGEILEANRVAFEASFIRK